MPQFNVTTLELEFSTQKIHWSRKIPEIAPTTNISHCTMAAQAKNAPWAGTKHKDASTYPDWKQGMDEDLWSRELMDFVLGVSSPPPPTEAQLASTDLAVKKEVAEIQKRHREWKRDENATNKLLRSSLHDDKKASVRSRTTPKSIYDYIVLEYGTSGSVRLGQLMTAICEVIQMKNTPISDKHAILINNNAEIKSSHPGTEYNDVQLCQFLLMSMSAEYTVEIRSLHKHATKERPLTLDGVKFFLEDLELQLNDLPAVKEELNYAGNKGRSAGNGCNYCGAKGHWKRGCTTYLASTEGVAWAATPQGIVNLRREAEYQRRHKYKIRKQERRLIWTRIQYCQTSRKTS